MRVTLAVGPSVEVERLRAWPLYWTALRLYAAFDTAKAPQAEFDALGALYGYFVAEAQPTWRFADHRGPIPATALGMLRLHVQDEALPVIQAWLETMKPESTAVDEVLPDSPLRDAVKTELRRKRSKRV